MWNFANKVHIVFAGHGGKGDMHPSSATLLDYNQR